MSVLISLINVVERITSSAEQFLLFGEDVDGNFNVATIFFEKLVCDLEIVENCVFDVMVKGRKRKVEFKVSNATTYILTFVNVRYKDCPYSKRISGAEKAMQKKKSLDKSNLAKLTKHNQLTNYISHQLKCR